MFFLQVLIGGDHETEGAAGRVAAPFAERRLDEVHHGVDERPRGEVLAGSGFLLIGVLLQEAFIEIAQALFPGAVPVQFVDVVDDLFQVLRLVDVGVGIHIDLLDSVLAIRAELQQKFAVKLVLFDPVFCRQVIPPVALGDFAFRPGFLGHLQEEDVGQLRDVLVIGDAVVPQDVTEIPEFLNDFGGVHADCLSDTYRGSR